MQNSTELKSNLEHSNLFIELMQNISELLRSAEPEFYLEDDLTKLKPGEFQELCKEMSKAQTIKHIFINRILSNLDYASIEVLANAIIRAHDLKTLSILDPTLFVETPEKFLSYHKPKKEIKKLIHFFNIIQKSNSIRSLELMSNHIAHMDSEHIKFLFNAFRNMTLEKLDLNFSFFIENDRWARLRGNEYRDTTKQYQKQNPYDAFIKHLSDFLKTSNIKTLYFNDNPLDALTDTQFKELMDAIANARHLRSLHLYHCRLEDPNRLQMLFSALGKAPNLVLLNLAGNGLQGYPDLITNSLFDSLESSLTMSDIEISNLCLIQNEYSLYHKRETAFKERIEKLVQAGTEAAVVLKEVARLPNPIINLFLNYSIADETRRENILAYMDKKVSHSQLKL